MEVGIVDYEIGNLKSVANAVEHVGGKPRVSSDPEILLNCERLILPGVGAFAHGMRALKDKGLEIIVKQFVEQGGRCLGICLGMQLLHQFSREFEKTDGLGLIVGDVSRITDHPNANEGQYRLPNVGWLGVEHRPGRSALADRMMAHVGSEDSFYFIHGYAARADIEAAVGISRYSDIPFASFVANDNLVGTQFHPEKSREPGLKMLEAFIH